MLICAEAASDMTRAEHLAATSAALFDLYTVGPPTAAATTTPLLGLRSFTPAATATTTTTPVLTSLGGGQETSHHIRLLVGDTDELGTGEVLRSEGGGGEEEQELAEAGALLSQTVHEG